MTDACTTCGLCAKLCTMGLAPHSRGPSHADCVKCARCVAKCPKEALGFERAVCRETD